MAFLLFVSIETHQELAGLECGMYVDGSAWRERDGAEINFHLYLSEVWGIRKEEQGSSEDTN